MWVKCIRSWGNFHRLLFAEALPLADGSSYLNVACQIWQAIHTVCWVNCIRYGVQVACASPLNHTGPILIRVSKCDSHHSEGTIWNKGIFLLCRTEQSQNKHAKQLPRSQKRWEVFIYRNHVVDIGTKWHFASQLATRATCDELKVSSSSFGVRSLTISYTSQHSTRQRSLQLLFQCHLMSANTHTMETHVHFLEMSFS